MGFEKKVLYNNEDVITSLNLSPVDTLRILKRLTGLPYSKIAERCKCSKAQIVLIFQEKYFPNKIIKQRLAECFNVNPFELWRKDGIN